MKITMKMEGSVYNPELLWIDVVNAPSDSDVTKLFFIDRGEYSVKGFIHYMNELESRHKLAQYFHLDGVSTLTAETMYENFKLNPHEIINRILDLCITFRVVYADGTDLVYVGRPEELRKYAITKNKFELEFDTPEFFMDDWDAKVFGDLYYAAHNERLDVTDFPQTFKTILSTRISTYWPKQIKFTKIPTEAKPHQLMFATTKVKQSWAPSMIGAVNLGSTVERKIIRKYATSQES